MPTVIVSTRFKMYFEIANGNKMNSQQLRYYPRLHNVFTEMYRSYLTEMFTRIGINKGGLLLNIYSCFVDVVVVRKSDSAYNALDIYNNEDRLNKHFKLLVGFVYTEMDSKIGKKYDTCRCYHKAFKELAHHHPTLDEIKFSTTRVTDYAQSCIALYQNTPKNDALLDYYAGWTFCSKEGQGQEFNLHLAILFDAYGSEFTHEIHQAISNYTRTQKKTTLNAQIVKLMQLLNEFTLHCPTLEELKHAMRAENSTALMLNVFSAQLAECISQESCVKSFFKSWGSRVVPVFTACLIDTGVFEEPQRPFVCPVFKEQKGGKAVVPTGGKLTKKQEARFFSEIPLEIKDEQAIEVITGRVNRDIEHVSVVCTQLVHKINERHDRNVTFRKNGKIKPYPYDPKGNKKETFPIGLSHLENTVATFYHHSYECGAVSYQGFLRCGGKTSALMEELNLPTLTTLMPFLVLLVIAHPKITPSWINEWELFDKGGNMTGFKQVGNQWVAVSLKNRRGTTLAQQEVILTEHSKFIVESLIRHTQFAREGLKRLGGNDWRYVALTSVVRRPRRHKSGIGNALITGNIDGFIQQLVTDSFSEKDGEKELILSKNSAEHIAPLVTLRGVRKNRGLQVYLETRSIKAVSEALGHKEPNLDMLASYLPQPLMDFFNARWIRTFQNAVIFEALKESPYLVEALDFSEGKLDEFLNNHRLGELPEHLVKANNSLAGEESQRELNQLDELIFTLTTPLLQVLIAISTMVENALEDEVFIPIIQKWYESAVFVLSHFTLTGKSTTYVQGVKESRPLYDAAVGNPLDINQFKGNFLCR